MPSPARRRTKARAWTVAHPQPHSTSRGHGRTPNHSSSTHAVLHHVHHGANLHLRVTRQELGRTPSHSFRHQFRTSAQHRPRRAAASPVRGEPLRARLSAVASLAPTFTTVITMRPLPRPRPQRRYQIRLEPGRQRGSCHPQRIHPLARRGQSARHRLGRAVGKPLHRPCPPQGLRKLRAQSRSPRRRQRKRSRKWSSLWRTTYAWMTAM